MKIDSVEDGLVEDGLRALYAARSAKAANTGLASAELIRPEAGAFVRPRSRGMRRAAAVTGAVAAVVAVAVAVAIASRSGSQHGNPAAIGNSPGYTLVLRDGDTATAVGEVVARTGQPVQFCQTTIMLANDLPDCPPGSGVVVSGVDLAKLGGRTAAGSLVFGEAQLSGVYSKGKLTVTSQSVAPEQPSATTLSTPPCATPVAGWPSDVASATLNSVGAFQQAHPGAIVATSVFRPSATTQVLVVMASGSPDLVTGALATYGNQVCVAMSKYSSAQVAAAEAMFSKRTAPIVAAGVYEIDDPAIDPSGNVYLDIDLSFVTPEIASLVAQTPPGLVRLQPWLMPDA